MDSICSILAADHARCDALFAQVCAQVRAHDWHAVRLSIAALSGVLQRHLQAEEQVVFAALDAVLGTASAATTSLRAEHRRVQGMLQRLHASAQACDMSACFKHAATLRVLLQQHHEKEERAFYPAAERILSAQRGWLVDALRVLAWQPSDLDEPGRKAPAPHP